MTTKTFIASRNLATTCVDVDGTTYYIVDDGSCVIAYADGEWAAHCDVECDDYTAWCQRTTGVDDADLAGRIAAEAGIPYLELSDGCLTRVQADRA